MEKRERSEEALGAKRKCTTWLRAVASLALAPSPAPSPPLSRARSRARARALSLSRSLSRARALSLSLYLLLERAKDWCVFEVNAHSVSRMATLRRKGRKIGVF